MREIEISSPDAELAAGDPTLREAEGSLPFMQAEAEKPGAVAWETVQDLGVVPAYSYRLQIPGQFSAQWTGPAAPSRLLLQRPATTPLPPIPPPAPALVSVSVEPPQVTVGGTTRLTVNLSAPWNGTQAAVVSLSPGSGLIGPMNISVPPGTASASATLTSAGVTGNIGVTAAFLGKSLSATVTVNPAPTPPPDVLPALTSLTVTPASVQAGQTAQLTAALSGPWPQDSPAVVALGLPTGQVSGPAQLSIPKGQSQATATITTAGSFGGTTHLSATLAGKMLVRDLQVMAPLPPPPPNPTPTPGPAPVPVERIVNLGGMSQAQIQAEIDKATPGTGLYFPAGRYLLAGASRTPDGQMLDVVNRNGITLYGDGPGTVIDFGGKEGVWMRNGGVVGIGNCIRDMTIQNVRRGVCGLDPQRLWVQRVRFANVGIGYASERTAAYDNGMFEWKTTVEDCVINGWNGHGMMLHGGEQVARCQLIDTPGNQGSTFSHGFYIASAMNVLIQDVLIANTSAHCAQVYSDSAAHAVNGAKDITFRRVTCQNCNYGLTIAANGPYDRIALEEVTITGTVSRNGATLAISGTNDWINNLTLKNVVLDGGGDAVVLQSGSTGGIRDMVATGLIIRNHSRGIIAKPPDWPYSQFERVSIQGLETQNVGVPVQQPLPPGVTVT